MSSNTSQGYAESTSFNIRSITIKEFNTANIELFDIL